MDEFERETNTQNGNKLIIFIVHCYGAENEIIIFMGIMLPHIHRRMEKLMDIDEDQINKHMKIARRESFPVRITSILHVVTNCVESSVTDSGFNNNMKYDLWRWFDSMGKNLKKHRSGSSDFSISHKDCEKCWDSRWSFWSLVELRIQIFVFFFRKGYRFKSFMSLESLKVLLNLTVEDIFNFTSLKNSPHYSYSFWLACHKLVFTIFTSHTWSSNRRE